MQITLESDYAVRCALYLSENKDKIAMVSEISRAMKIPKSFLAKILQKLTKAKIVVSYRGVQGGFKLARDPGEINLLEVMEAVDDPVSANRCVIDRRSCDLVSTCCVHPVWVDIRKDIEVKLKRWTFARLMSRQVKK
jgi:Rrf2 family protein